MPVPEPDPNEELRERSGRVSLADPFVTLFYDLCKLVPLGELEKLVRDACRVGAGLKLYSNGWLALYAQDMVRRLDNARESGAETEVVQTE